MLDREKIILMTEIAIEEKNDISEDKKIASYYIEDYLFINNFKTVFSILVLSVSMIFIKILLHIEKGKNIPTTASELVEEFVSPFVWNIILFIVIYSLISTYIYGNRYQKAEKRMKLYIEKKDQVQNYNNIEKGENNHGEFTII
ncbi:hypothetical protein AN639_11655 [Candidatus Epulonipiscium fishelsonii]|uniref:Uncharacterized protein n=1 Tax=Candidatus Epulonipiscium fishelsonii TaxID=77094 RepID=A0ACC8XFS3_9FIRM|nr:hypothetical protein AN396_01760 [Epulopiscium sp. SCG-B11WGA-EpuloA1]ONI42966.1 hypothetical protein AN639_11655 [Epulopiscium sp. SCG-B05WGA-EpuloA1]